MNILVDYLLPNHPIQPNNHSIFNKRNVTIGLGTAIGIAIAAYYHTPIIDSLKVIAERTVSRASVKTPMEIWVPLTGILLTDYTTNITKFVLIKAAITTAVTYYFCGTSIAIFYLATLVISHLLLNKLKVALLNRLIEHQQEMDEFFDSGMKFLKMGKYEEAQKALECALKYKLSSDDIKGTIYTNLSILYAKQGKYDKAQEIWECIFKCNNLMVHKKAEMCMRLCMECFEKAEYKRSQELLEYMLEHGDFPDGIKAKIYVSLGNTCFKQDKYIKAQKTFESALAHEGLPDDIKADIYMSLGHMYLEQGKYDETHKTWNDLSKYISSSNKERICGFFMRISFVYVQRGKIVEANKIWDYISKLGISHGVELPKETGSKKRKQPMNTRIIDGSSVKAPSLTSASGTKPISSVLLRNGEHVPKVVMASTRMTMKLMLERDPVLFWTRLVEKAKDPDYELSSLDGTKLREYLMLQQDGVMHDHVRAIILSSIEGESSEQKLVHPMQGYTW